MRRGEFISHKELPPSYTVHDWLYCLCYEAPPHGQPRQIVDSMLVNDELYLRVTKWDDEAFSMRMYWVNSNRSLFSEEFWRFGDPFFHVWREDGVIKRQDGFKPERLRFMETQNPMDGLSIAG